MKRSIADFMAMNNPGTHGVGALRAVLATLQQMADNHQRCTLVLVVDAQGSTYRKPGALLLVDSAGVQTGTLSGGCLESELVDAALDVLARDQPVLKHFDSRSDDDALFGSGSGCRGVTSVLLLPIDARRDHALVNMLLALQTTHLSAHLAAVVEGSHLGALVAVIGNDSAAYRTTAALAPGLRELCSNKPQVMSLSAGVPVTGKTTVAVMRVLPVPTLLVIGAGPEVPSLTRIAREVGWRVTVLDHRAALLDAQRIAADELRCERPAIALGNWPVPVDAAVIMTHTATHDLAALRALAHLPVAHVALLGPPRRRDELLNQLAADERNALLPRLQAPAGLSLGGEGPEAIALSIVAGLPVRR